MPKTHRIVINSSPFETRVALLEDDLVAEIFLDRVRRGGVAGNIYKGRIRKVLAGMQSAFVDIGLERDAFLHVSDVVAPVADEETGLDEAEVGTPPEPGPAAHDICDLLSDGEEVLVQVAKEAMAGKGARVTTHVSLAGRHVVCMPTVRHVGVSRRIEDAGERSRLRGIMQGLLAESGFGFIARTVAEGCSSGELGADAEHLASRWRELLLRAETVRAPALIERESDLIDKLSRDIIGEGTIEIVVDHPAVYQRLRVSLPGICAGVADRVRLHVDTEPVFEVFGVEEEIERALRAKVWMKSGGYIVINQTEALVAIDVNTGRFVGKIGLEDTVLRTNLEAVREIVRQIRLRDLGGIIVLDFIDMEELSNRERVVGELEAELRNDRSRSKILQISAFGIVEMTRKRVKGSLERLLCRPCSHCSGTGREKSIETICYEVRRAVLRGRRGLVVGPVELRVHPEVAAALAGPEDAVVRDLSEELGLPIEVRADASVSRGRVEIRGGEVPGDL